MTEQGNGAPPAKPAGEISQEVIAVLAKDISLRLSHLVGLLALQVSPEDLAKIVVLLVQEQLSMTRQILPSLTAPARVKSHPRIGMRLQMAHSGIQMLLAPKRRPVQLGPAPITVNPNTPVNPAFNPANLQDTTMHTIILAMLLDPAIRGLLRIYGVGYDFIEEKAPSLILSPHGRKV